MSEMLVASSSGSRTEIGVSQLRVGPSAAVGSMNYGQRCTLDRRESSGMPKKNQTSVGSAKEAEWARLGDFFSRLASGDHKSLYEEVLRSPRKNPDISRVEKVQSTSKSPSRPVEVPIVDALKPLELIPLTRCVSSGSTSSVASTSSDGDTNDGDSSTSSPPSSISSLPSPDLREDATLFETGDEAREECYEPTRGRMRIRTSAGRFAKPRPQALAHPTATIEEEDKEKTQRNFTFKMMLHELYENLDEFTEMVARVLEDSKEKYRPLDMEREGVLCPGHGTSKKTRVGRVMEEDMYVKLRDRTTSNLEGKGQMEMVQSVIERATMKRRVKMGGVAVAQYLDDIKNSLEEGTQREVIAATCAFERHTLSTVFAEESDDSEGGVPDDVATGRNTDECCKTRVDEQGLHAPVVRSRTKRRLSL